MNDSQQSFLLLMEAIKIIYVNLMTFNRAAALTTILIEFFLVVSTQNKIKTFRRRLILKLLFNWDVLLESSTHDISIRIV